MEVYPRNEPVPTKVRRLAGDRVEVAYTDANVDPKSLQSGSSALLQAEPNGEEDAGDDVEYVEESAYGHIVQGEDGQYYVVMDKNTSSDIELDKLNNVQVVTNEDGTETLILEDTNSKKNARVGKLSSSDSAPAYNIASTEEGGDRHSHAHPTQPKEDDDDLDGENDEFNVVEQVVGGDEDSKFSRGLKQRRSRVYGSCRCPECGQSFVNTARLERHLAVHQIFGSYLCPLCGKTYKYEYNLFYHWRKTCRDMNDLLDFQTRKVMEVNNLRKMVEEIARKKVEIGPLELGISGQQLYRSANTLERGGVGGNSNANSIGRKAATCKDCGVTTLEAHLPRHMAIHRGEVGVDEKSVAGGFFCELCGLMFREHFNLIKHWRSGCPEIQANLPESCDIALDDSALKEMVRDLLKKACLATSNGMKPKEGAEQTDSDGNNTGNEHSTNLDEDGANKEKQREQVSTSYRPTLHPGSNLDSAAPPDASDLIDVVNNQQNDLDERWAEDNGIMFADDYLTMEDDEEIASHMLMMNDDGQICSLDRLAPAHSSMDADRLNINQTVQCSECYRSFANTARLERHLAGAHCSIGTHHCILCGNRFKYDYNLLYHYRRSCGYTKMWIEQDIREQLDAVELKKLVRRLANREVRLSNNTSLYSTVTPHFGHRQELGDSIVRRQMMRSVIPTSQQQPLTSSSSLQLPQNLQLASRPGLPETRACPICSVNFYGASVLSRHIRVAHPNEYEMWEPSAFDGASPASGGAGGQDPIHDVVEQDTASNQADRQIEPGQSSQPQQRQFDIEPPPTLQPEPEVEEEEEAGRGRPNQPLHQHHTQMRMANVVPLQSSYAHHHHNYSASQQSQQQEWVDEDMGEDVQERIEVIPSGSRRVIQTRQRTRSGYKETSDPPPYYEVHQVHQMPTHSNYHHQHHIQQQMPHSTRHVQNVAAVGPSSSGGSQQKPTPSVLRRSTRSSYQHPQTHY